LVVVVDVDDNDDNEARAPPAPLMMPRGGVSRESAMT
jgi:hypothetical protein